MRCHALVCGAILALLVTAGGSARAATSAERIGAESAVAATVDPHLLALDIAAFPRDAVVNHEHVDSTAAAVNAEHIFGATNENGGAYQRLHFYGTVVERAILPRYNVAIRQLWLMATVFPSSTQAAQAYLADSAFDFVCQTAPALDVGMPTQTCTYIYPAGQQSGMYVVGVAGNVEFVVVGFVQKASLAARERAARDASFLTRHEAGHVLHLLHLRRTSP